MPVDEGFADSFFSSFLGNKNSSFSLDNISSPAQLNTSVDRKRKYYDDENQDVSSSLASHEHRSFTYTDTNPDEKTDFLQMSSTESKDQTSSLDTVDKTEDKKDPSFQDLYNFTTKTEQHIVKSPKSEGKHLLGEDRIVPHDAGTRALPSDMGTRAIPNDTGARVVPNDTGARVVPNDTGTGAVGLPHEIRNSERLASILNNLPSHGMMDERDLGASGTEPVSSYALLPMRNLVEKLSQQMKDGIVQDWSRVFSNMECLETAHVEQLDQILIAALDYEAKLKSEKAELRNFLMKLSGVFQHD